MSRIKSITIDNYRSIKHLHQDFGEERFVVLIGRGDSGKSTILSAIYAVLNPSWNATFTDLDFYKQETTNPIEIVLTLEELPDELFKETKFGFYFDDNAQEDSTHFTLMVKLIVDSTLEPHWYVCGKPEIGLEDKPISAQNRAIIGANFISDYADTHFAYNRQSPLYSLTKCSLDEEVKIEHVKSAILRDLSSKVNEEKLEPLNKPIENLKQTATKLGLSLEDLYVGLDISDNPYTGNSIALHHDSLPFRTHGKGNKRLMSIAIQNELTKTGGIVLIDELEQGLEPDRIMTLVRILKGTNLGQVFVTTHSLNVLLETDYHNLFVVKSGSDTLFRVPKELDSCRRSNPQAFFAKKIVCCEGKTELGLWRAIDLKNDENFSKSFSAYGVVLLNANGGNNMYTYALKLKSLGYDVCIFADNDTNMDKYITKANQDNIPIFLCDKGLCLEKQIINDLPWNYILKLIACPQDDFPVMNIDIPDDLTEKIEQCSPDVQPELRVEISNLSVYKEKKPNGREISHEWFKHIPGGEFLGTLIFESIKDKSLSQDCRLHVLINSVLKWCYGELK